MRRISLLRFNALAGYCRAPMASLLSEEIDWFEHGGDRVLGVLIRDRHDNDFGGIVLGRDRNGRFRCIAAPHFYRSAPVAMAFLRTEMERLSLQRDEEFYQGDDSVKSVDLFTPVVSSDRLNNDFVKLTQLEGYSPARGIIEPMMHWYEDLDGNFVEQFQTTGYDARFWELYLFATFVEMGYRIENIHAVPDFSCKGILGEFAVEAMTVNPSRNRDGSIVSPPPRHAPEQLRDFLRNYMPIKFGSTLTSKLAKNYWEKSNVRGKPLLFAIQDFSAPQSMVYTPSALPNYLYGYDYDWIYDNYGRLKITPQRVNEHRWGNKVIPSGFFNLPGAENVSAVVFSNSGTISKFNRMGFLAGFGSHRVVMVRLGTSVKHDPDSAAPCTFRHVVNAPEYSETWVEGLSAFHNPRAIHPIDPDMLPGAAHHRLLQDGMMESITPDFHPFGSFTLIHVAHNESDADQFIRMTMSQVPDL